jgi:hypothetical protein
MTDEEKEALRERNRRRAWNCHHCGGETERIDGSKLDQSCHFAGVTYKVCRSCGREEVLRRRK